MPATDERCWSNACARLLIGRSSVAMAARYHRLELHPWRSLPRITQPAPLRQLSFLDCDAPEYYRITIYSESWPVGGHSLDGQAGVYGVVARALRMQFQARGCALSKTSSSWRIVACVYLCVVDSEECPSNS